MSSSGNYVVAYVAPLKPGSLKGPSVVPVSRGIGDVLYLAFVLGVVRNSGACI